MNLKFIEDDLRTHKGKVGSTIIYAQSVSDVESTAAYLSRVVDSLGESEGTTGSPSAGRVMMYHAKLGNDARHHAHVQFLTGHCSVLVATVAFGMGIDKVLTD